MIAAGPQPTAAWFYDERASPSIRADSAHVMGGRMTMRAAPRRALGYNREVAKHSHGASAGGYVGPPMTSSPTASNRVGVLFTCAGRRVELIQAFRAAARRRRIALEVTALDHDPTAPSMFVADHADLAPRVTDPTYIPAVLEIVEKRRPAALIPTVDTDLAVIAEQRDALAALGCCALIGEPGVIRICRDKVRTFEFLKANGVDTPATFTPQALAAGAPPPYPLFIKPRTGSASLGTHKVEDLDDLNYYLKRVPDPIVQEFVAGVEHTLDVYVGLGGSPRCVVPRARWQVRNGEVSKGVVVKDREVMDAGRRVVEALGPSVRGLVTLQCIVTTERRIRFIEINPRFGGGAPMGIAAGADYPGWLLDELLGRTPAIAFDGFRHGLCMLRYDWSVFVQLDDDARPAVKAPLAPPPEFGA